ncbi:TPA: restriction endonuclease subunit S [Clostridium perfringens]|uniref:restriction endonuclease subunit S n=1 Tax=Clostridium perfringens TaxID=1502 RepID=UPI00374F4304
MSGNDIENKALTKVPLIKYFSIESPRQDDKINFNIMDIKNQESIPFLGRSSVNNGIVAYVEQRENYINEGGVITIALDGSTGSTFYQMHKFSSGQNIWILRPKKEYLEELTPEIAMFLITTIRIAVKNYTYNLSLTKTRLSKINILLPIKDDKSIDSDYIIERIKKLRNSKLLNNIRETRY